MKSPITSAAGWRSGALGALCAIVAGLLAWRLGGLDVPSFDLPFLVRPQTTVNEAVIVYLDEPSARTLGQPWTNNLPWSRELHARLIRRLVKSQARAIVFDVLFDLTTEQDKVFLAAVRAARAARIPVVVGAKLDYNQVHGKAEVLSPVGPFPELAALAQIGLAEQLYDTGEKPRQHSPGFGNLPSLAERTAQVTSTQLPDPLPAERWINFYGPALELPHRSFEPALDPERVPDSFFAGKVCFVGARSDVPFPGGKPTDEWHIPHTRWGQGRAPGVEVNATVYVNLVHHEWLTRLSTPAEVLIVVGAGLAFGLGLALFRPTTATVLACVGFGTVAIGAAWLMWQHHHWTSWLVIDTVQIPVALGWAILSHTRRLTRENLALQKDLARLTQTAPASPAPRVPEPASPAAHAGTAGPNSGDESATLATPAPAASEPAPPAIPDHTLLRCIGKGAYGEVWLAQSVIVTCHAVKIVRRADFDDDAPFEREFRGIQKFMPISRLHPGLVQILHAGRNPSAGFFYYIMEPADDETTGPAIQAAAYSPKTLSSEIKRRGWIPVAECVRLALRLTDALEFLHSHELIHRDIKPSNIIFVRGEPKLADIGLVTDISTPAADASFVGTRGYIPPEGPGQAAADVFSLGRVLYEACMGLRCDRFPQLPDSLIERPDHESLLELNQIILKACEEDVRRRYQRAAEMQTELEQLRSRLGPG